MRALGFSTPRAAYAGSKTFPCCSQAMAARWASPKLVALWMINRQRDSLELLAFMDAVIKADVHVVRNGYFGAEHKFALDNGSTTPGCAQASGALMGPGNPCVQ
jgi:hypothetical protein